MDEVNAPARELPPRSAATWWLAPLAFFLGVALCALVVAAGGLRGDEPAPAGAPQAARQVPGAAGAGQGEGDLVVARVPSSCLAAMDGAAATVRELDDLAAAARGFDARRLQEIVDQFQQLRPEIEEQVDVCRDETADGLHNGTLVTEASSTSASP